MDHVPYTVSSHFRVFVLVKAKETFELHLTGMEIYSSETGAWTYRQIEWGRWYCSKLEFCLLQGHSAFDKP